MIIGGSKLQRGVLDPISRIIRFQIKELLRIGETAQALLDFLHQIPGRQKRFLASLVLFVLGRSQDLFFFQQFQLGLHLVTSPGQKRSGKDVVEKFNVGILLSNVISLLTHERGQGWTAQVWFGNRPVRGKNQIYLHSHYLAGSLMGFTLPG